MPALLLFGASGAIGQGIREHFARHGWSVTTVGRQRDDAGCIDIAYDPLSDADGSALCKGKLFDAVCWAQGANTNDSIYDLDIQNHRAIMEANCLHTVISLNQLLKLNLLKKPARLCVISSIWQEISRPNKFSYTVSKSALKGLVLAAAADLARDGHLINAVLPGVLDTPMTRANLSAEQIAVLEGETLFNRLANVDDIAYAAYSLLADENKSITGQFITVDLGFSNVRCI